MPLFAQAPRFNFKLYSDPVRMARSIKRLLKQVMDLLHANAPVFQIHHANINYQRQLTAEEGFFTVRVRAPGDWNPNHPPPAPVIPAFSLKDLYLVGYQDNADQGIWKLYYDADLIGSGTEDPANANQWQLLQYKGGYIEQMYGVSIGVDPMINALHTLNNPNATDMAKRLALGVFIVTISEACRFPRWKRKLVSLLRGFQTMILNQDDECRYVLFTDWSSISKRVRKGPARFIEGDGFATYKLMIEVVCVLLGRPPANEL